MSFFYSRSFNHMEFMLWDEKSFNIFLDFTELNQNQLLKAVIVMDINHVAILSWLKRLCSCFCWNVPFAIIYIFLIFISFCYQFVCGNTRSLHWLLHFYFTIYFTFSLHFSLVYFDAFRFWPFIIYSLIIMILSNVIKMESVILVWYHFAWLRLYYENKLLHKINFVFVKSVNKCVCISFIGKNPLFFF